MSTKGEPMDRDIPYIAFESVCARFERTIKRLWILIIILAVLLVGTNGAWLWYTSQFDDVIITQENEDGYNNYIGEDGYIAN